MELILAIVIIVAVVKLRHWLYHGRGRWVGVKPPNNVVYLRRNHD